MNPDNAAIQREALLIANHENIRAIFQAALSNGAPVAELAFVLINVTDSFGGSLAKTFGANVDKQIATAPEGTQPAYLAVVPEQTLIANFERQFPSLARKAREAHDGKIWVLVADAGAPALLSVGVEQLAQRSGGDA
jgi:hypothetical protein